MRTSHRENQDIHFFRFGQREKQFGKIHEIVLILRAKDPACAVLKSLRTNYYSIAVPPQLRHPLRYEFSNAAKARSLLQMSRKRAARTTSPKPYRQNGALLRPIVSRKESLNA